MQTNIALRSIWLNLSLLCFVLGIVAWLPNILFHYGYGYWMLTLIINPLGIVFAVIAKSKFGIIANAIMTFSFFIFMFIGYLFAAIF